MNETKNQLTIKHTKMIYMKKVKKFGNGAYVGVPKELIGQYLYVVVPCEKEIGQE